MSVGRSTKRALAGSLVVALAGSIVAALAGGLGVFGSASSPESPSRPEPLGASDAGPREELESFIAMRAAFAEFRDWPRHPVDGAMLPVGVEPAPTYIYANRPAPVGRGRWPVGTVLVKVIESGGTEAGWTIHAMVKRGVPFNPGGAAGWEFFELSYAEGDELTILWRGEGPPSGHGYAAMNVDAGPDPVPLVCNDCHAASWQNDGVLTPALALR